MDATGTGDLRPAETDRISDALGASPGSLGAVGVDGPPIYADHALRGRSGMTTGANEDDFHLEGVDVERDIEVDHWLDLRRILDGEPCGVCGEPLEVVRCIEAGHIFKLGTMYSEVFQANFLDQDSAQHPIIMGCYGIGIGRLLAATVEQSHDDNGMILPPAIAPYEAWLTALNVEKQEVAQAAESLYRDLVDSGVQVLYDDREESAGVKFKDADLLGLPVRLVVSPRNLRQDVVEVKRRAEAEAVTVPTGEVVARVKGLLSS